MLKLFVVFVLLFFCSCSGSECTGPAVRALKLIETTVTSTDQISKDKYAALVADARVKLEAMQPCLPVGELNGEFNEHLRNALIHYDEALDVWAPEDKTHRKKYWEMAREELSKIE